MQDFPAIQAHSERTGIPDEKLLDSWVRDRREEDFTEIVRRHLGLVQGIARRQLDPVQAEDIAQQVFIILARKAASLTGLRSLSAWLHQVTLLQCRSAIRVRMRERKNLEAAMETARIDEARDPLADALPYLDEVIGRLTDSDRELILLRYSEGLSFSQVAARTGRKEAALRQQASRAVEKLSQMLMRRGVSIPVATLTAGLGIHLAGTSTATAAVMVSATALANSAAITGISLASISFFTMTTKQSLLTGAALAALLISGPLVWRATEIHRAAESLTSTGPGPATPGSARTETSETHPKKTKTDRTARPMSEVDRARMMAAIPGILERNLKEAMTGWFKRDAWLEARRVADELNLSGKLETELRDFLISERASMIDKAMERKDDQQVDYAARHREADSRLDAWFAARLTPQQMEDRKRLNETRNVALVEKLAGQAVETASADLGLAEEQKSRLYDAAAAKADRAVREKAYPNGLQFAVSFLGYKVPIEEEAADYVRSVLEPAQQELWNVAIERDHLFGETLQKNVIGGVLEQIQKVRGAPDEPRKSLDQK